MIREKISSLIEKALRERPDLFLIDLKVSEANAIKIIIDGDNGVVVDDCVFLSRKIEGELDRDQEDFSLEVSSAGATSPLEHVRQFKKNLGRTLEVKTVDNEKYKADLTDAGDEYIVLSWKAREPKPVGKGKITVKKEVKIAYDQIDQAKVKIKF